MIYLLIIIAPLAAFLYAFRGCLQNKEGQIDNQNRESF